MSAILLGGASIRAPGTRASVASSSTRRRRRPEPQALRAFTRRQVWVQPAQAPSLDTSFPWLVPRPQPATLILGLITNEK